MDLLARRADADQFSPIVVCLQQGSWPAGLRAAGIETYVFPRNHLRDLVRVARIIGNLVRIIARRDVQIVHANGNSALVYASVAARLSHTRLVWHLHDPQRNTGLVRSVLLRILQWCDPDAVVFSSPAAEAVWKPLLAGLRATQQVILPGVDTGRLAAGDAARARRALGLPTDAPVVTMLARPVAYKGQDLLVEALPIIRIAHPNVRVVFAGMSAEDEWGASIATLAFSLGVEDNVVLPGYLPEDLKVDLLAATSILAHPSRTEPLGLAMLEGMAAGVPVVAAATDGARLLVSPGQTGVLVPVGNQTALGEAIAALLDDAPRRQEMGSAAAARADSLANGRMVKDVEAIWEAVTRASSSPECGHRGPS